jgi:hypothetical protein
MIQRTAASIIPAWFISLAILISGAPYNGSQAHDNPKNIRTTAALACGKEIKRLCGGVRESVSEGLPMETNNVLWCFQKKEEKLSARCATLAMNVVRMCDSDVAQLCPGVVASSQGNIVGCLTTAEHMVSAQCNKALDAASLR